MRSNTPLARTLALGASAAVIVVAAGTAATAAPRGVSKLTAALRLSSAAPVAGNPVQIDVHGTKLPAHDAVKSITVTFGDKTKAVHLKTLKGSTKHAFAKAGTYTVTVTIVDKHGKKSVKTKKVTVKAKPTTNTGPTNVSHAFPIVVPATATPTTTLGSLLSAEQLGAVSPLTLIPTALLPYLPVGFLGLLPAADLTLPPNGLPRLPGLGGLNLTNNLLGQLTNLTGLPLNLPTSGVSLGTKLGDVPVLSFAQLGTLSALFGVPSTIVSQLPLVSLWLLPSSLLHLGSAPTAGLPLNIPLGLDPTATIASLLSTLNLDSGVLTELASLLSTPPAVLGSLPVGFLKLLTEVSPTSIVSANNLPGLPGLTGINLGADLVTLLTSLITHGLSGFPLTLPAIADLTQTLGSLPSSGLTGTQAGSLATIFNVPASTIAQLPVLALHLLPTSLFGFVSGGSGGGGGGGGGGGITLPTLPIAIPIGLIPTKTITDLIASLGLPGTIVDQLAAGLNVPTAIFEQLPVGVLKALPSTLVSLPGDLPGLPGLNGLPTGNLVTLLATLLTNGILGSLTDLPVTIPSDFDVTKAIGALPSAADGAATLTALTKVFGNISLATLNQLPVSLLKNTNVFPSLLLSTGGTVASYLTGLPATLSGTLTPATLISSLGLSATALSSISSLLNIPTGTLTTLPAGFLKLLPAGNLTGSALPALPGIGTLPLVGNLLAMLLSGLPVAIPAGTSLTTLISSLPGSVLSVLQLATLSTVFGIPTGTLSTLPVSVLKLLPTGYLTGL